MSYKINFCLWLILLTGCDGRGDRFLFELQRNEQVKNILGNKGTYGVFVLNETGCISCNRLYLDFIVKKVSNNSNFIIYSTASGIRIDISPFLTDTIRNMVEGNIELLRKYHISEGSYFLKVQEHKIDTTIAIKANDIVSSLAYIEGLDLLQKNN